MQGSNSGICWGDFKLQVCLSGQKWSGMLSSSLDLHVFNVMFHQQEDMHYINAKPTDEE